MDEIDPYITCSSTGELQCLHDDHSTSEDPFAAVRWCKHIEDLVVNNRDCVYITPPEIEKVEKDIEVPMFPTKNMWASVRAFPMEKSRMWEIWWKHPEKNEYDFIQYLHAYEGRNVLRMSLLNFMLSDDSQPTECMDSAHGFAAQQEWAASKNLDSAHLAQMWCVYYYHKCLHCLVNSDVSDLVPEKEGSPWS